MSTHTFLSQQQQTSILAACLACFSTKDPAADVARAIINTYDEHINNAISQVYLDESIYDEDDHYDTYPPARVQVWLTPKQRDNYNYEGGLVRNDINQIKDDIDEIDEDAPRQYAIPANKVVTDNEALNFFFRASDVSLENIARALRGGTDAAHSYNAIVTNRTKLKETVPALLRKHFVTPTLLSANQVHKLTREIVDAAHPYLDEHNKPVTLNSHEEEVINEFNNHASLFINGFVTALADITLETLVDFALAVVDAIEKGHDANTVTLTLPEGSTWGIFDPTTGSGSLMECSTANDTTITMEDLIAPYGGGIHINESQHNNYGYCVMDVYGDFDSPTELTLNATDVAQP